MVEIVTECIMCGPCLRYVERETCISRVYNHNLVANPVGVLIELHLKLTSLFLK